VDTNPTGRQISKAGILYYHQASIMLFYHSVLILLTKAVHNTRMLIDE